MGYYSICIKCIVDYRNWELVLYIRQYHVIVRVVLKLSKKV